MGLDIGKLLSSVFEPQPGEEVLVACDVPQSAAQDSRAWRDRRSWAEDWQRAFVELGHARSFNTKPLLTYIATGAHGSELPQEADLGGRRVTLEEAVLESTLAVFMTEYSATAALDGFCRRKPDFRAASLPGLERRMENTSLAADYREVARRCRILYDLLNGAGGLAVRFSTGHSCYFDLRFRRPEADDGYLPRFKPGDRVINLPSGETFIVPYEGERAGTPSATAGSLPIRRGAELVLLIVEANRIVRIEGDGPEAGRMRSFFEADRARMNIAEVAFGCNDRAVVTGNVLEDEKAGFHWAYGRSDHLGGVWGIKAFASPKTVVHEDIVYAQGNPIQVADATVERSDGRICVIKDAAYQVF